MARPTLISLVLFGLFMASAQDDPKLRVKVVHDLAKGGASSLPKIEVYLDDPEINVRIETVKAIVEIGTGRSIEPLVKALREFQELRDEASAIRMKQRISDFYDHNIKYLMYRDWSGFELFYIEILKCGSLAGLHQIGHRFETFLMTLFREVQKRSILQSAPLSEDLQGIETGT